MRNKNIPPVFLET